MTLRNTIFHRRQVLGEETSNNALFGIWIFEEMWMGRPALETGIWSLSCLFGDANSALTAALQPLKHADWFMPEHKNLKDQLQQLHLRTEETSVMFWVALPILLAGFMYCLSLLYLILHFLKNSGRYSEANQFYNDLIKEGASYVKANYDEASLQPYFEVYKGHVFGIWWPFNYLSAAHRQGCCYRRRAFGGETKPLILSTLLVVYGATMIGFMRPWFCGHHLDKQFMVYANTITCGEGDHGKLTWYAYLGCVIWGLLFPVGIFYMISHRQHQLLHEEWWKAENCILIIGYNAKCAWWEAVNFFDKFCLALVAHNTTDNDHQVLLQMFLALSYGAVNIAFRPCDKRCNGLLWKAQIALISLRVVDCIMLDMLLLTESSTAWGLLLVSGLLLNLIFVYFILRTLRRHALQTFVNSYDQSDSLSWLSVSGQVPRISRCRKMIKYFADSIAASHKSLQRTQPYVSFDNLLGWVTIVGNRGDLAVNPSIERGHRSHNRSGRPDLSCAPLVPTNVSQDVLMVPASVYHRMWLQQVIVESMSSILTSLRHGSTFSVSLMEFVIRAGFLFAHKHSTDNRLTKEEQESSDAPDTHGEQKLPDDIVMLTMGDSLEKTVGQMEANQFLHNLSHDVVHKLADMHTAGRVKTGSALHLKLQESKSPGRTAMDDLHSSPEIFSLVEDTETTLELLLDEVRHRTHMPSRLKAGKESDIGMDQAEADETVAGQAIRVASKGVRKAGEQVQNVTDASKEHIESMHNVTAPNHGTASSSTKPTHDQDQQRVQLREKYKIDYELTAAKKAQLTHWVRLMLNPHLYSRGVRLELLQQGMMRMQMMRRGEVKFMLDKFENAWVDHMSFKALVLKRYANATKDMPMQADIEESKPEITLNDLEDTVAETLKLGRFSGKEQAQDPVKQARAAYRWARLAAIRGNAFSNFNSAELVRICKHNTKRKYYDLEMELARKAGYLDQKKELLASLAGIALAAPLKRNLAGDEGTAPAGTTAEDEGTAPAGTTAESTNTLRPVALVTGAGSGIGRALALLLAENGSDIVAVDNDSTRELRGPSIAYVVADVGTAEGVDLVMKEVGTRPVKILAHVAGVIDFSPLLTIGRSSVNEMIRTHMYGAAFLTAALAPNLKADGSARILLTAGSGRIPSFGGFGATEAALKTLWLALRDECADFAGVALCMPGVVRTPFWDKCLTKEDWQFQSSFRERFESGDFHTAEEVAQWMTALLQEAQVNATDFKGREHNIDNPEQHYGVKVTLTSEGKGFVNATDTPT